ncbi:hypothetical protein M405DRAFT_753685, partial [Rhizopogon salebrosus TDB-379]
AHHAENHDLSCLQVLGWNWCDKRVGRKQCAIVDTFWQTEIGFIIMTLCPGAIETKPGSATIPFIGIEPTILDPASGKELEGNNVEGALVLEQPWSSIAGSIYNDYNHYLGTYMKPYPGLFYTSLRDGTTQDGHDYIWIKGHIDGKDLHWRVSHL